MKKVSKTKIAKTYATAMFEALKNSNKALADVNALLELVGQDKKLIEFVENPVINFDAKKDVIAKLKISQDVKSSIEVIVENNRGCELELILKEYVKIYYQKNNIGLVDVVSTYALKTAQLNKLQKKLKEKLKKDVVINNVVDKDILGGLVIKYDSQMIDASVMGKLKSIEKIMKGEEQ